MSMVGSLVASMSGLSVRGCSRAQAPVAAPRPAMLAMQLSGRSHIVAAAQRISLSHAKPQVAQAVEAQIVCGKLKTRKAAAKRFKITARGKVISRRPGKQHINEKMSSKRLSQLGKEKLIPTCEYDNIIGCLPFAGIKK